MEIVAFIVGGVVGAVVMALLQYSSDIKENEYAEEEVCQTEYTGKCRDCIHFSRTYGTCSLWGRDLLRNKNPLDSCKRGKRRKYYAD